MRILAWLARHVAELRRRHVFRVAGVYAIAAWMVVEVASVVLPHLRLPDWTVTLVIVLALLGLPVALVLAWAFELTPEGVVRDADEEAGARGTPPDATGGTPVVAFRIVAGVVVVAALTWIALDPFSGAARLAPDAGETGRSVLVLPLANAGTSSDSALLGEDVAREIVHHLSRVGELRVVSAASASRLDGTGPDGDGIADGVDAAAVLRGSIARTDGTIRISADLVSRRSEKPLWSGSYEREAREAFGVTADIPRRIAEALGVSPPPASVPTRDREALDLFLRARRLAGTGDRGAASRALELYRQAVSRDTLFGRAYARIALLHATGEATASGGSRDGARTAALAAADRALGIDGSIAEAHLAAGLVRYLHDRDWSGAGAALRRAVELRPGSAEARIWRADYLVATARPDSAVAEAREALRLDPLSPGIRVRAGAVLYQARRYREAVRILEGAARDHPDLAAARLWLAAAELARGEHAGAYRAMRDALARPGDEGARRVVAALSRTVGASPEAAALLRNGGAPAPEAGRSREEPFWTGVAYAVVGRPDSALAWLRRAAEARDPAARRLDALPLLDPLRDDPRFGELLRSVRLRAPGGDVPRGDSGGPLP